MKTSSMLLMCLQAVLMAASSPVSRPTRVVDYHLDFHAELHSNAHICLVPNTSKQIIQVFAVGTTYGADDYNDLCVRLAQNGMVAVILDYQVGVPTKQDESYMKNIPRVLAALKTESMHWASTYNTTVVGTDLTDIVTGGHSAGGRSSFTHGLHNPSRALVLWDPIHVQSYSLPKDYRLDMPQLIMTTADSGCKYAINAMDNGVSNFNAAKSYSVLVTYTNTKIHHNSIASKGIIGELFCYSKVEGLAEDVADKFSSFIFDPLNVSLYKPLPAPDSDDLFATTVAVNYQ